MDALKELKNIYLSTGPGLSGLREEPTELTNYAGSRWISAEDIRFVKTARQAMPALVRLVECYEAERSAWHKWYGKRIDENWDELNGAVAETESARRALEDVCG